AALRTAIREDGRAGVALLPAQQALREAWVDQSIRAAERQRAALAARIAAARGEAVQSLGRHRALETLVERGEAEARQQRLARAEREAPPPGPERR
ncbi:MAG TPA: hypothetical protein VFN28_06745, partial [Amaricoccus sp.]|nr:hypothetical protein [Amaricoccus sp.]